MDTHTHTHTQVHSCKHMQEKTPAEAKGFHGQLTPTGHSQTCTLQLKRILNKPIKTIATIKAKKTAHAIISFQKMTIKSETRVELNFKK